MPRRSYRRSFKSRSSLRTSFRKNARSRGMAAVARRQFKVLSARSAEHKLADGLISTNVGTAGGSTYLAAIAEGSDINQRTGRTIRIESIQFRYDCAMNPVAGSSGLRVQLVYVLNPQAFATWLGTDFWAGTPSISTPMNVSAHIGQIVVLYDKIHRFSNTGEQRQFGKFFRKMNHKVRFSGVNTTDFQLGQFAILLISDDNVSQPGINLYSRVRFRDEG